MDLDDRFRGAMGKEDKVLGLRAVAAELLAEGRSRDEVLAAFESLRDEARRDGREEDRGRDPLCDGLPRRLVQPPYEDAVSEAALPVGESGSTGAAFSVIAMAKVAGGPVPRTAGGDRRDRSIQKGSYAPVRGRCGFGGGGEGGARVLHAPGTLVEGDRRTARPTREAPVRKVLRLHELEPRRVPAAMAPDVAVLGVSTPDSQVVNVSYKVDGLAEGQRLDFDLAIVRSSDDQYDGADRRVATAHVEAVGDGSGSVRGTAAVEVPRGLVPVPKRPYVLAVADPDDAIAEPDESNNVDGFRKHVIAVVTHGGIQESSYPPPWAVKLSQGLRDQGYDAVLTFTWASRSETPGAAPKQGPVLANDILLASRGRSRPTSRSTST